MNDIDGIIFDIRRFSTHDGPGIRTTVFFKGCPLSCVWCHNPESQEIRPEIMLHESRCITCGACIPQCAHNAISRSVNGTERMMTDRNTCTRCGECLAICYADARQLVGQRVTAHYVIGEILRDLAFFDESGGGVTISGGEPLYQPEFLAAILQGCRTHEIHTALDTSGFTSWEILDGLRGSVDLFLYDLKLMDEARHRAYTGVSNRLILENLQALSAAGHEIILRIPLIPGINDDPQNISQTALFASKLENLKQIDILPYHNLGFGKYNGLGKEISVTQNALSHQKPLSEESVERIVQTLQDYHLQVHIG